MRRQPTIVRDAWGPAVLVAALGFALAYGTYWLGQYIGYTQGHHAGYADGLAAAPARVAAERAHLDELRRLQEARLRAELEAMRVAHLPETRPNNP